MKGTHPQQQDKRNLFVLFALITIPLLLTLILWTIMPSGYRAIEQEHVEIPAAYIWHPLQAGLKQVALSF